MTMTSPHSDTAEGFHDDGNHGMGIRIYREVNFGALLLFICFGERLCVHSTLYPTHSMWRNAKHELVYRLQGPTKNHRKSTFCSTPSTLDVLYDCIHRCKVYEYSSMSYE